MKAVAGTKVKTLIAIIVIVLELVACLYLLNVQRKDKEEMQRLNDDAVTMNDKLDKLSKTTVPTEDYNRVVTEHNRLITRLRSLKDAAVGSGRIAATEPLSTPEQICVSVEQSFRKPVEPPTAKTGAEEVDILVTAVSNEIAQRGVIDTQQTEKYAFGIYLIQKVLDAMGYPIQEARGIKNTYDAVMKFQGDQQLKQDGKVGNGTWGKVHEVWETKKTTGAAIARPATIPVTPMPAASQPVIKIPATAQTPTTQSKPSTPTQPVRRRVP